jgi:hypothetical protein
MTFEEGVQTDLVLQLEKYGFRLDSITSGVEEKVVFSSANIILEFRGVGRLDDGSVRLRIGSSMLQYSDLIDKYCPGVDSKEFRDALGCWTTGGLKLTEHKKVYKFITSTIGIVLTELRQSTGEKGS